MGLPFRSSCRSITAMSSNCPECGRRDFAPPAAAAMGEGAAGFRSRFRLMWATTCLMLLPLLALAQMPIYDKVKRAESDHFVFIFQASLQDRVPALMKDCEDAYALLCPVFHWTPRGKTYVLYSDDVDVHNGWANVYPRPTMQFYIHATPPQSVIYEPGGEMRRTVFHEFTHILSLDAQYGVTAAFARVFGRVLPTTGDLASLIVAFCAAPPGVLAPLWFQEGLSTWVETEFVGPGRGRNSFADMLLRTAVADGRALTPREWDLHLPEWPYGSAAYLYGMRTMQFAEDCFSANGEDRVPGELSDAVAHSFGFVFNRRARGVTGRKFSEIARQALLREEDRQRERIKLLQSKPITPVTRLTPENLAVQRAVFAGDSVFFVGRPEAGRDTLYRYEPATGRTRKIRSATVLGAITRLTPSPDGRRLYFTRLNYVGRDRLWQQLCCLDVRSKRVRSLGRAGRYNYPAVDPSGSRLAAVRMEGGTQTLVEVPLADAGDRRRERVLVPPTSEDMLIDPLYARDGRSVYYVRSDRAGSQVRRFNLDTGDDAVLLAWPCVILSPALDASGERLVFAADRNGVYNLYALTLGQEGPPAALTHVVGGMFDPSFSADGRRLAAVGYDSHGPFLTLLDAAALPAIEAPLPALAPDWRSSASNEQARAALADRPPPAMPAAERYNSFAAVRADYWTPWLIAASDGVQGGLAFSLSDPAGYQGFSAGAGADSDTSAFIGWFDYTYAGLYPILDLFGHLTPETYPDLLEARGGVFRDYEEQLATAGISLTLPLPRAARQFTAAIGYRFTDRRATDDSDRILRSGSLLATNAFEGTESSVFGTLAFFNGTAYGRSHSVESGRLVSLTADHADEVFGGQLNQTRLTASWIEYVTMPFTENHVLKLSALGATGAGDETAQGLFGLGGYGIEAIAALPDTEWSFPLRGYDANTQVGTQAARAGAAYRFPVVRFYKGGGATLPLYMQQVFAEVFYEGGKVWGGERPGAGQNPWINAAGAEVNFSLNVFRFFEMAPGVGVVYAFDRAERRHEDDTSSGDKFQYYLSLKSSVNF